MQLKVFIILSLTFFCTGCLDTTAGNEVTELTEEEEALSHLNSPCVPIQGSGTNGQQKITEVMFQDMVFLNSDNTPTTLYNNITSVDPTYAQLMTFLQKDQTDQMPYLNEKFVCSEYACTLHNESETYGYRCGFVIVAFENHEEHALNIFNTTDKGVIFIDATGVSSPDGISYDAFVSIEVGEDYQPVDLFCEGYTRENWGPVKSYLTFW